METTEIKGHQMEDCEDVDGNECQAVDPENTIGERKRYELALLWVQDDLSSV